MQAWEEWNQGCVTITGVFLLVFVFVFVFTPAIAVKYNGMQAWEEWNQACVTIAGVSQPQFTRPLNIIAPLCLS